MPLEDHDFMIEMIASFVVMALLPLESIGTCVDFFSYPNKGRKIQSYVISRNLFDMVKPPSQSTILYLTHFCPQYLPAASCIFF
ncbi:hypothetical protein SAMN04515620_1496 [Collimonas sp. OK607]|nr:hypothetical protein SAMN04515620_1496 [Collimonas sp. OK607]